MKALILAAGKGSRLGTIGEETPKPLLAVGGRPILEHHLNRCANAGVREVFINTHHLAGQIRDFCGDGSRWGLKITFSFEPVLLGTAGAVNAFRSRLDGEPFIVIYGDNVMELELPEFIRTHCSKRPVATVAVHYREDVSTSGMVVTDDSGRIRSFIEKPAPSQQVSHWVNAAVYLLEPDVLDFIPREGFSDFGRDVFPALLAEGRHLHSFQLAGDVHPVDTPELLAEARKRR
ncbi:MAG: nucleotidyltransferase family protein [Terrimicrobiaceae bacterium]|nr:nucleotidyltransferase family protein [Terrimicrobiaceae bacterium]